MKIYLDADVGLNRSSSTGLTPVVQLAVKGWMIALESVVEGVNDYSSHVRWCSQQKSNFYDAACRFYRRGELKKNPHNQTNKIISGLFLR